LRARKGRAQRRRASRCQVFSPRAWAIASANSWRCNDNADFWKISSVLRDPMQFVAIRTEMALQETVDLEKGL